MKKEFNKGLLLTSLGSFWWGFIGVLYFEYVSFIGHIELVVHRCLWTAVMLIITTSFFSKWNSFLKIIRARIPDIITPKPLINVPIPGIILYRNHYGSYLVWDLLDLDTCYHNFHLHTLILKGNLNSKKKSVQFSFLDRF